MIRQVINLFKATVPILVIIIVFAAVDVSAATRIEPGHLPDTKANTSAVKRIITIVNGLAGAIALLLIVVNGLRYITSGGDPQKASSSKNGIIYALLGVAVVLASQAIVVYVTRGLG